VCWESESRPDAPQPPVGGATTFAEDLARVLATLLRQARAELAISRSEMSRNRFRIELSADLPLALSDGARHRVDPAHLGKTGEVGVR
jgi:hypothetical protein